LNFSRKFVVNLQKAYIKSARISILNIILGDTPTRTEDAKNEHPSCVFSLQIDHPLMLEHASSQKVIDA